VSPYPSGWPYDQQAMIRGFLRAARAAALTKAPVKAAVVAAVAAATTLLTGCGFLNSGAIVQCVHQMTVSSEAFSQNILPRSFTCHVAKPQTPPVAWFGAPSNTSGYALVVDDSSAPITPYVYWIVFGIGPTTTDIQQGMLPPGAKQATNSAGFAGYDAPCPQGQPHSYRFTVYALDKPLNNLPAGTSLQSAWTAIAAAAVCHGRTVATGNP
jgi:Raf kinase inhibitor-like YbhB/YbcL family protein